MQIISRKQRRPPTYWKPIAPEMEQRIMHHFWNEHENETSTIAKKFGLDKQQISLLIDTHIDEKKKQINKRINKKL